MKSAQKAAQNTRKVVIFTNAASTPNMDTGTRSLQSRCRNADAANTRKLMLKKSASDSIINVRE
jgi:hypothetical protein